MVREAMHVTPKQLRRIGYHTIEISAALLLAFAFVSAPLTAWAADVSDPNPLKYESPASLTGTICDVISTNVLFKFKRTATRVGTNVNVVREFTTPDGTLAARETLLYEGDNLLSYDFDEFQIGAIGSARILHDPTKRAVDKIEFSYQVREGKNEKTTESLRPNTLSGDMVGRFLVDHLADLSQGREINCRFLVVSRRETVGFSFSKQTETTWRGTPVVVIRMAPTSMVIGLIVEPLFFTIEKNGKHRVLQYTGRTTPKIKSEAGWKDLDAVTSFDWK